MKIAINSSNEIVAYAIIGTLENGIECIIPESVLNDNPLSYLYQDWQFVKNAEHSPPTETGKTTEEIIAGLNEQVKILEEVAEDLGMNILLMQNVI